jgi:hypothetical protein
MKKGTPGMKLTKILFPLIVFVLIMAAQRDAKAQPRFGMRFEMHDGGNAPPYNSFYLSLGDYYRVPYGEVCELHGAGVRDDDIPTILYIHSHSPYSLRQIYSLRLRGASWDELSMWCGVPLERDRVFRGEAYRGGPPHGNAYGYYARGRERHSSYDGRDGYSGKYDRRGRGDDGEGRGRRDRRDD